MNQSFEKTWLKISNLIFRPTAFRPVLTSFPFSSFFLNRLLEHIQNWSKTVEIWVKNRVSTLRQSSLKTRKFRVWRTCRAVSTYFSFTAQIFLLEGWDYNAGVSQRKCALKLEVSVGTIGTILKRYRIGFLSMQSTAVNPKANERAEEMFEHPLTEMVSWGKHCYG